jgi:hypothetical protein
LNCRIPVMLVVSTGDVPGGWITLPVGTYESDPTSNLPRAGSPEDLSYDRAFNRWILATWNHVSPDGRRYVTQGSNGGEEIVDVATGAVRPLAMPAVNGTWYVIDWNAQGVYFSLMGGEGPGDPGLWLLNPDSGAVRQLDATEHWTQVDSRAAWAVGQASGTMLLRRMDLASAKVTTELAVPFHFPYQSGDQLLELIALDAQGRPLVLTRDWQKPYPWRLALVVAPDMLQDVSIPSSWAAGWPMADTGDPFQSFRDVHGFLLSKGIWLYGSYSFGGLALLTPDGVLMQLTDAPNNIWSIAGGCH